jgi:hypothetical protein
VQINIFQGMAAAVIKVLKEHVTRHGGKEVDSGDYKVSNEEALQFFRRCWQAMTTRLHRVLSKH